MSRKAKNENERSKAKNESQKKQAKNENKRSGAKASSPPDGPTPAGKSKHCELHHPKSGMSVSIVHFAAFGHIDKGVCPCGMLIDPNDGTTVLATGRLLLLQPARRCPKRMFWGMVFTNPAVSGGDYTLRICDANSNKEVLYNVGIVLSGSWGVNITWPALDDEVPYEFLATGTADPAGGDVSGTMTNCDTPPTSIEQYDPPPNWSLYCSIVNPTPPCVLTVTQGVNETDVGGLTFGTS